MLAVTRAVGDDWGVDDPRRLGGGERVCRSLSNDIGDRRRLFGFDGRRTGRLGGSGRHHLGLGFDHDRFGLDRC